MLPILLNVAAELRALTTIGATLSIVCCLLLLLFTRLLSRRPSFTVQLLLHLTIVELIAATSNLIYRVDQDSVELNPQTGDISHIATLCRVQATLMHFGYLSTVAWLFCLCTNNFLTCFLYESHPKKFEIVYLVIGYVLPAADALVVSPLGLDYSGPTDLWCFLGSRQHATAQWIHFYLPQIILVFLCLVMHVISVRALRGRIQHSRFGVKNRVGNAGSVNGSVSSSASAAPIDSTRMNVVIRSGGVSTQDLYSSSLTSKSSSSSPSSGFEHSNLHSTWRTYFICYILLRLPAIIHRGWEWFHHGDSTLAVDADQVYFLELMHAVASPLQGLLLLILYLQNPRLKGLVKRKIKGLRAKVKGGGSGPSSGRSTPGSESVTSASSSSSASPHINSSTVGSDYKSLIDASAHASSPSSVAGLQAVFPQAAWSQLVASTASSVGSSSSSSSSPLPPAITSLIPPVSFRTFPTAAQAAASSSSASSSSSTSSASSSSSSSSSTSYRIMSGTFNMGNELPPMDASHPSFDDTSIYPTDASTLHLNKWIPSGNAADEFDIIAVGVQECLYDVKLNRSSREYSCCSWRDSSLGLPSTESHWFDIVCATVNFGRDSTQPPKREGEIDHRPFHVIAGISMGHIRLIILLHPRHLPSLHSINTSIEAAGLGNVYENKGGIGIGFNLGMKRFIFVNVHLAALDGFVHDRNEDVVQILARMQLCGSEKENTKKEGTPAAAPATKRGRVLEDARGSPSSSSSSTTTSSSCTCAIELDPTLHAHFAVFLGDLNYRLVLPTTSHMKDIKKRTRQSYAEVLAAIQQNNFPFLKQADELCMLLREKRLFVGWCENELDFYPTYKYKLGLRARYSSRNGSSISADSRNAGASPVSIMSGESHTQHDVTLYDGKRVPAWCDRILYRSSSYVSVKVREYREVFEVESSDHKPVCATMDVEFGGRRASGGGQKGKQSQQQQQQDDSSLVVSDGLRTASSSISNPSNPSTPPTTSSLLLPPTGSPARRRKGSAAELLAEIEADPTHKEMISPQAMRMLSSSVSASLPPSPSLLSSSAPRAHYRIRFHHLSLYDALDVYGSPLTQPYISFVSDLLCARQCSTDGAFSTTTSCIRYHTSIATPLPSSGDALLHASRADDLGAFFQSSTAALAACCVKCAEWDGGDDGAPVGAAIEPTEIPLLHTAYPVTLDELHYSSIQLIVKDADTLGEVDALGVANVELAGGIVNATNNSHPQPIFFISPILAQTKYMGFISGYFLVEPQ